MKYLLSLIFLGLLMVNPDFPNKGYVEFQDLSHGDNILLGERDSNEPGIIEIVRLKKGMKDESGKYELVLSHVYYNRFESDSLLIKWNCFNAVLEFDDGKYCDTIFFDNHIYEPKIIRANGDAHIYSDKSKTVTELTLSQKCVFFWDFKKKLKERDYDSHCFHNAILRIPSRTYEFNGKIIKTKEKVYRCDYINEPPRPKFL